MKRLASSFDALRTTLSFVEGSLSGAPAGCANDAVQHMWRHRHSAISIVVLVVCSAIGARATSVRQATDPLQEHAAAGERALAEGRYADAEREYETLRKLSPATAEVHARLGLIYFQEGKFDAAVPTLREAIRLKPGLPKVDALLSMSLSEIGRYEEALPGVTKAFSQSADPVLRRMAGLHLQRIYTGLGRDQDAVDVALKLSRLYPDDPEVLYHSGRLFANYAYLQTMRLATVAPMCAPGGGSNKPGPLRRRARLRAG